MKRLSCCIALAAVAGAASAFEGWTVQTGEWSHRHATWSETMVALRETMLRGAVRSGNAIARVAPAPSPVQGRGGPAVAGEPSHAPARAPVLREGHHEAEERRPTVVAWHYLHRDFPIETEQFRARLSVDEANAWFAERDSTEIERTLIDSALKNGDSNHFPDVGNMVAAPDFSDVPPGDARWLTLFADITRQTRAQLVADCPPIAFIKREAHARKGTNGTMLGQLDLGRQMGSSICIYDPSKPGEGAREIFRSETGFIFDMSASFDGRKLVFSYHDDPRAGVDSFHIWEINTDGTELTQLTSGPYHDASPSYLPDGRVVFTSTRVESFSLCQDFLAAAIFAVDPNTGAIERLEYTTLCDTTPFVMDDGSIVFTRWEYQDKNIFCTQGLWSINPDGRHLQLFYGNTLTIPNAIYGAKQIPGTRKVVCTMAAHHHRPIGAIGIIDRSLGLEAVESLINITPEVPYTPTKAPVWNPSQPNSTWGAGDVFYPWAYGDPYPIRDGLYLVTYGGPEQDGPGRFRLFLLRDDGSKISLYDAPSTSCFNPVPLRVRPLPHRFARDSSVGSGDPTYKGTADHDERLVDRISRSDTLGTFFVTDIHDGLAESGVKRGQVKALRVMSQLPKRWNTEGPRYRDHYPLIGQGTYYVKVNYGTVPVYEDGTAYFEAPAGVELYFIALDEHGKEIRRMGSTTQLMPGESQGCVGCHPTQPQAPPAVDAIANRLAREPDRITPEPWDVAVTPLPLGEGQGVRVSYPRQVQPVLDRYCISCHSGHNPAKRIDLTGGKSRFYSMSYRALVDGGYAVCYYLNQAPTGNFQPMQSGSWVSPLTKLIEAEHQSVKMDDESRRRVYAWIDANVPYYDTWDMSRPHTMGGRDTWFHTEVPGERSAILPDAWYADFRRTYDAKCASCHPDPSPVNDQGTPTYAWINLTTPKHSRALNAHLAESAGGMGLASPRDGQASPAFADTDDPDYQAMLRAIQSGAAALTATPRVDMPGATVIAQERNFGRMY